MKITYLGHSSFLMEVGGKSLLFDPFISPNPMAKAISIKEINPDYILLSHGHGDHVADAEAIARQSGALIISNYEIVSWYEAKGLKGHPMNHGGRWDFDFGSLHVVNAVHSSVLPDGTYGGNATGFVIQSGGITFYYAGDTALTYDMKLIGEEYSIDFAFLPIGSNFTMNFKDALKAASFVGTKQIIGMHYDTFPYIKIDKDLVLKQAAEAGISMKLPEIGETFSF